MSEPECDVSEYNGQYMEARIASVFVLLFLSAFGSFFPILALRCKSLRIPAKLFFMAKYFGSGVIISTAFIHLLGESQEHLSSPCLSSFWSEYPWASAFALIGAFTMFSIELVARVGMDRNGNSLTILNLDCSYGDQPKPSAHPGDDSVIKQVTDDDFESETFLVERQKSAVSRMLNLALLEFGVVFHSIFVGLTLAIVGDEFPTLFIAISFHQLFEGLGMGSRFASVIWPESLKAVPWCFATVFSLSTPIGTAVGLGVRTVYVQSSTGLLLVMGISSLFCAGLLIYNSMVELMARDFIEGVDFKSELVRTIIIAYTFLVVGVVAMAVIGRWA